MLPLPIVARGLPDVRLRTEPALLDVAYGSVLGAGCHRFVSDTRISSTISSLVNLTPVLEPEMISSSARLRWVIRAAPREEIPVVSPELYSSSTDWRA
jgi:hypothetical protein